MPAEAAPPIAGRFRDRLLRRILQPRPSRFDAPGAIAPRRLPLWGWALLMAAIALAYLFIVSAGKFVGWPVHTTYYDYLAEGFRAGHLHLSVDPSPELLAKPDPYAHENMSLWLWDVSLYDGKYYLYWGPVPALLLAAVKVVFRISGPVSDDVLVFVFEILRMMAGAVLLERIARRLFPKIHAGFVALAILVFAFSNPTPHTLARAAIYEAAIVAGQAFAVAGLAFAFEAIWRARTGRPEDRYLVLAGICWGLAVGCRASLAPALVLIMGVTVLFLVVPAPARNRWRRLWRGGLALGTPPAAAALSLLIYNKARFGAWLDFGLGRQLSDYPFITSAKYLTANLISYLVRPFGYSCRFPFVKGVTGLGDRAFPKGFKLAEGYFNFEAVVGVLNSVPWSWLAVVPLAFGARALVYRLRRGGRSYTPERWQSEADPRAGALLWCLIAFAILASLGMIGVIAEYMATMRFLNDGMMGGLLFCTLGAWMLLDRWNDRPRLRLGMGVLVVVLATGTILVGAAFGFTGPYNHFKRENLDLYYRLGDHLSVCR